MEQGAKGEGSSQDANSGGCGRDRSDDFESRHANVKLLVDETLKLFHNNTRRIENWRWENQPWDAYLILRRYRVV
jgi:hypothetical protein